MDITFANSIFKSLQDDNLAFMYSGVVSDNITHKIIELTQSNIDSGGNFIRFKNKISFLMAECYQNVARHSKYSVDNADPLDLKGAFYVRSFANTFHIGSVNAIKTENIESIREKLNQVNSLSAEDLRLLQKQVLRKGKLSERGGAGLGIIEMARRTGEKILYEFTPMHDGLSLFFIQLNIHNDEIETKQNESDSLTHMKGIYKEMQDLNLLVVHKGDFSENSVLPIIHMIEKNILKHNEVKSGNQRLYNISVELLQNISMHALREKGANEALFLLQKTNTGFTVATCNYIDKPDVAPLEKTLAELYLLNKDSLNKLYLERMKRLADAYTNNEGLGIVYIFRKSDGVYHSITTNKNKSLLTFVVKID